MKLTEARLCMSCEEIHTGWKCPKCGQGPSYFVDQWLKPAVTSHHAATRIGERFRERRTATNE